MIRNGWWWFYFSQVIKILIFCLRAESGLPRDKSCPDFESCLKLCSCPDWSFVLKRVKLGPQRERDHVKFFSGVQSSKPHLIVSMRSRDSCAKVAQGCEGWMHKWCRGWRRCNQPPEIPPLHILCNSLRPSGRQSVYYRIIFFLANVMGCPAQQQFYWWTTIVKTTNAPQHVKRQISLSL